MANFPNSASALVDELDRMFPERPAEAGQTEIEIHRTAAKRELVLILKHWRDQRARDVTRNSR
jgi:quinol monooxygenase YgiN